MVESKRFLVLATCFLSGTASVLSFVSLFTQGWVYASGKFKTDPNGKDSSLNYGLFGGTYSQASIYITTADISMTCSYSNNICAVLCAKNADRRSALLDELYNTGSVTWNVKECANTKSMFTVMRDDPISVHESSVTNSGHNLKFINAYANLSTMIFLIISGIVGLISAGLSVWNTASNPVEVYFSIFGLYIYNSIALGSLFISFTIWLIMFCTTLLEEPSFILTLNGDMSVSSVSLGWSYWINLVSLLLYGSSIGVLYSRSYLIAKDPQLKVEIEDNSPGGILLF